jgi:hypothetical protein
MLREHRGAFLIVEHFELLMGELIAADGARRSMLATFAGSRNDFPESEPARVTLCG